MIQTAIYQKLCSLPFDRRGQDLIEYALLAGMMATSATALSSAVAATASQFGGVMAALAKAIAATAG